MAAGWLGLAFAVGCLCACGGAPPPVEAAEAPEPPSVGDLATLAPADATLVVLARPAELWADPSSRRVLLAVFDEAQLDAFSMRTGVDPRRLEELVIAVCPDGHVVIGRGPLDAPFAVREAGERMAPLEASVDEPLVRRVGFPASGRVDLAAPAADTVIWIDGPPQRAAGILAAATSAEHTREHALAGTEATALRAERAEAPLVALAPQPLDLPRDTGVGLLLARQTALAVEARPDVDGALRFGMELRGEFPPGAEENFQALAASIAESDLGAALGARDALPTLRIETEDTRVSLRATVASEILAAGLRTLFVAEMRELLSITPRPPQATTARNERGSPVVLRREAQPRFRHRRNRPIARISLKSLKSHGNSVC